MARGGHNWKGGGTVEGMRSLDVVKLARAGVLANMQQIGWQWSTNGKVIASINIQGGRDTIVLDYRVKRPGKEDWQTVQQPVPIVWTSCRFGGERPWFVCAVQASGVYCGRRVATLYSAGRLFACRRCCRLAYASQRGGRMDQAHHRLARLHLKIGAEYDGPDGHLPEKPKWMRWRTFNRVAQLIEAGEEHLDTVFIAGAQRLLDRADKMDRKRGAWR